MVGIDYLSAKKSKEVVSGSKGLAGEGGVCYFDCMFSQLVDFFFFFFLLNGNLNLLAKWRCLEMPLKNILQHIKGITSRARFQGSRRP